MTDLSVAAGKTSTVTVFIDSNCGTEKLNFKFICDGECGFGVFYCQNDLNNTVTNVDETLAESEMVFPAFNRLYGPCYVPMHGEVICEKAGYYVFAWSNKYAWWNGVKISYQVIKE